MYCLIWSIIKGYLFVSVPSIPLDVQSFGGVVVWNKPLNSNGQIAEYNIQFLVPGTQSRMNRSRNGQGTFYSVQNQDRVGGMDNTYFRVRFSLPHP